MDKIEYNNTITPILDQMDTMSLHQIQDMSREINNKKTKLFEKNRNPKYKGHKRRLTESQFYIFLNEEKEKKYRLIYKIMFYMGLRVSEIPTINLKRIIDNKTLIIENKKCKRRDILPISKIIKEELIEHIENNKDKIKKREGRIFYNEKTGEELSKDAIRNRIRKIAERLIFNRIYDKSKDNRRLNTISSHSFRRSFARRIYEISNHDIELVRIALRIKSIEVAKIYIESEIEDLIGII